jgi:hypothetical protein
MWASRAAPVGCNRLVLAVGVLAVVAAGCGTGAGSSVAGRTMRARGSRALPDTIYEYQVSDTPKLPYQGREVVWYDPATGELRDKSGIGTAVRELVIAKGGGATQTDWNGDGTPDTIVYTGSARFVRQTRPGSATWLLAGYLNHRRPSGHGRIVATHEHGHLTLSSTTGKLTVTATILRTIDPTPAISRRLYTLHPQHVTERFQQFTPTSSGGVLPGGFWLGTSWKGLGLDYAYTDTSLEAAQSAGVSYGFSYGNGRLDINSGVPEPGTIRLLTSAHIFGKPHACTLADGTPAKVFQFRQITSPGQRLASNDVRELAKIRFRRVISAKQDTSIIAAANLLPSLTATCRALQPAKQ